MAGQAKRATELRELAELVADVLTAWHAHGSAQVEADLAELGHYRPTLTNAAKADAFDAAMVWAKCPIRAWRGSKSEARS